MMKKKLLFPLMMLLSCLTFAQISVKNSTVYYSITSPNAIILFDYLKTFDLDNSNSIDSTENTLGGNFLQTDIQKNTTTFSFNNNTNTLNISGLQNYLILEDALFKVTIANKTYEIIFPKTYGYVCPSLVPIEGQDLSCSKFFSVSSTLDWLDPKPNYLDEAETQGLTIKNTTNQLALEFTTPSAVIITDFTGNTLAQNNEKNNSYTLKNIASGMYILTITNQNGYVYKTKTWVP